MKAFRAAGRRERETEEVTERDCESNIVRQSERQKKKEME